MKLINWTFSKLKNIYFLTDILKKKMKWQAKRCKKIFGIHVSDKGVVFQICKEFYNLVRR